MAWFKWQLKWPLKWQQGRQKTGYEKMRLIRVKWPRPFDIYVLKFDEGQAIPAHIDPVKTGAHHRINIILKHADEGGEFLCKSPIFESRRVKYFRPDVSEHAVTRIVKGRRYVLSIGWVRHLTTPGTRPL